MMFKLHYFKLMLLKFKIAHLEYSLPFYVFIIFYISFGYILNFITIVIFNRFNII